MSGPQPTEAVLDDAYVAVPRAGLIEARFESERVVWNPHHPAPAYLEPVAALLWSILDGEVSVGELVDDVVDVVGIGPDVARPRIMASMHTFRAGGLLADSPDPGAVDDFFPFPPSH